MESKPKMARSSTACLQQLIAAVVICVAVGAAWMPDHFKGLSSAEGTAGGLGSKQSIWEQLGEASGASPDIVKLLVLILASTPLSLPLPYLSPLFIHLYSISTSAAFMTLVLDLKWGLVQLVSASVVTWVLVSQGRGLAEEAKDGEGKKRAGGKGRRMPWVVFFLVMAHLTVNHARRIFGNIPLDVVEITGAHMVLVMKLSTFAWNVYDGARPLSELDPYQQSTRITEMPNLLEFLGYCLFFPGMLVGPSFTFAQYRAFTSKTLYSAAPGGKIPSGRFSKAGQKLLIGFGALGVYALYGSALSYESILLPQFLEKSAWQRFVHLMLSGFTARTKYYIVWSFSEAAFAVSGCGFDAVKRNWTAGQNLDIMGIELAQNYKGVFDSWNQKTNVWLRECVYKRVAKSGKKPGEKSTMATFVTSAAWHGPQAGYYFAFVHGAFIQSLGRHIRSTVRPFFLPAGALSAPKGAPPPPRTASKLAYDLVCAFHVQATLNYLVIPFMLLEVAPTLEAYKRMGYFGHIVTVVPLAFYWCGGGGVLKASLKGREKKAGGKGAERGVKEYEKEVDEKIGVVKVNGVNSLAPQVEALAPKRS